MSNFEWLRVFSSGGLARELSVSELSNFGMSSSATKDANYERVKL
jgi:hypothetical protein